MSGPQVVTTTPRSSIYYIKGVPSVNNVPAGVGVAAVYDGNNAWLFGGISLSTNRSNALWELFTY